MELKNFDQYFSEMSDSSLLDNLLKRNGFNSIAKEAMIKEAIKRQIIFSDTEDEISEIVSKMKSKEKQEDSYRPFEAKKIVSVVFYILSISFCIGGIVSLYMFFTFAGETLIYLILGVSFLSMAYVFYRLTKDYELNKIKQKQCNRKGSPILIAIGYFASITGLFFIGLIISLEYYYSCKREDGIIVAYKYDEDTRKHGRIMLIINTILLIIVFGYLILWNIGNNL